MTGSFASLNDIADFLANEFAASRYPASEQGGLYRFAGRRVQRLGLALEPWPDIAHWVVQHQLDSLYLHRPWRIDDIPLPADVSILAHHLPFDETLTMGFNTRLAAQLRAIGSLEPLGFKQSQSETGDLLPARPIGMVFDMEKCSLADWETIIRELFGGYDQIVAGATGMVSRVAVVGAMNDSLIREAAGRGVDLYLTGAYRKPAQEAVTQTGIVVMAVGHRRSEEWGLRALADLLRERWPELTLFLH
ncbi:hypothetical protein HNV11_20070 [Spirosoma taeanense]|uniref:NGG1p interacting factor NIF3 n=1 Tax=Spirosoma taeanense TaxID=2735870 RepID=A0A6M5YET6_9BACT|nr:Nif3-like dinuclear metal center hexameric protein [Spirosoma taeanense]QJW91512.1 hypothetical protein HNV11_20070 [Spirosoma taeanense]